MNLTELLDEIREIEIYNTDPQDWMGYLEDDNSYVPDVELAYCPHQRGLCAPIISTYATNR